VKHATGRLLDDFRKQLRWAKNLLRLNHFLDLLLRQTFKQMAFFFP
jgi:hypothetical protein